MVSFVIDTKKKRENCLKEGEKSKKVNKILIKINVKVNKDKKKNPIIKQSSKYSTLVSI